MAWQGHGKVGWKEKAFSSHSGQIKSGESARFWRRGKRDWSFGPWATCILPLSKASCCFGGDPAEISVHKTKNYHLTWEHRGEIQCFLIGFMGCRANFPPRRAAQQAEAFHLWGAHLGAQRGSRGYIPWGGLHVTNSPLGQHHQQLHLTVKPKQNQRESVRHRLHQHSWRENSPDTFWEEKNSDFWFIKLFQAWEKKLSGSVGRFWEGSSRYTGEWQTTLNFSGRRLSCGIVCISKPLLKIDRA